MNYSSSKYLITFLVIISISTFSQAGTLFLKDGSQLEGALVKIHDGKVEFQTQFAGVLSIDQALVSGLESDSTVYLKTDGGEVLRGALEKDEAGLSINSSRGSMKASVGEVVAAWREGDVDPIVVAREEELKGQMRKWKYEVGVDISSSDGNTEKFSSGIAAKAILEGPDDELVLYGQYKYTEANGVRSEDEQKAGMRFTNYFSEKLGWFIRSELERDKFEQIEFRSTTAVGLSYRWIKEDNMKLETSAGISYRYEDYFGGIASESFPGLDFGLDYYWKFAKWGELNTELGFIPSIDDFGDYLVEHVSAVDIPLAQSDKWKLRIGLSNQYNSSPGLGRKELDTSYFIRLLMNWK